MRGRAEGRDGKATGLGFRDALIPRDRGHESRFLEKAAHFLLDFHAELRPRVVHCEEESLDLEGGVELVLDVVDGREDRGDRFHREILALDGNENARARGKSIEIEKAKGWGTVDDDVIVTVLEGGKRGFEQAEGSFHRAGIHRGFEGCQTKIGGNDIQAVESGVDDRFLDADLAKKGIVNLERNRVDVDA